jgi:hypothetical protein
MPEFLLHHQHSAGECKASFAAWKGFTSPLRGRPALCTCLSGRHGIWWQVEAGDPQQALALLPPFVAERTDPIYVREVQIP